jgi:hypothetical protein
MPRTPGRKRRAQRRVPATGAGASVRASRASQSTSCRALTSPLVVATVCWHAGSGRAQARRPLRAAARRLPSSAGAAAGCVGGDSATALIAPFARRRARPPSRRTRRRPRLKAANRHPRAAPALARRGDGRACVTSRRRTGGDRNATARRASRRAPARVSIRSRSPPDDIPCSRRTCRPCRCAPGWGRRSRGTRLHSGP